MLYISPLEGFELTTSVIKKTLFISDIDECSDPSTNNCTTHASCHDTDGGFYCVCNTDYEGVGDVNCTTFNNISVIS
jgi:hypothetical protein